MSNWQDTIQEDRHGELAGWIPVPDAASLQIEERWAVKLEQIKGGDSGAVTYLLSKHLVDSRDWAEMTPDEIIALILDRYPELDLSDIPDAGNGRGYFCSFGSVSETIEYLLTADGEEDEYDEDDEALDLMMGDMFGQLAKLASTPVEGDEDRETLNKSMDDMTQSMMDKMGGILKNLNETGETGIDQDEVAELRASAEAGPGGMDDDDVSEEEDPERLEKAEAARRRSEGHIPVDLDLREELTDADVKAIDYLIANGSEVVAKALDALAVYDTEDVKGWCEFHESDDRFYEVLSEGATGRDLIGRVSCVGISMVEHPDGQMSYTQLTFERLWDEEHLINVTMHGGRVVDTCDSGGGINDQQLASDKPAIDPFTCKPIEPKN